MLITLILKMFTEWYLRPVKNRLPTSTAGRTYCLMPPRDPLETRSNCTNKLKHGLYILSACVRVFDQPPSLSPWNLDTHRWTSSNKNTRKLKHKKESWLNIKLNPNLPRNMQMTLEWGNLIKHILLIVLDSQLKKFPEMYSRGKLWV